MPSSPTKRRFFLCTGQCVVYEDLHKYAGSHILGELRRMTDEGRRVTALALYEKSVPANEVPPVNPEIVMFVIGDGRRIRCRHKVGTPERCSHEQRWELGRAGFLALMDRMGLQDKLLELEKEERKHEPVA